MTTNGTNRAQQWAQSSNETLNLPSGRDCVVRPPNALTMIMEDGDMPDFLYSSLLSSFNGGTPQAQAELSEKEQLQQLASLLNRVLKRSLISPKIVDEKPDLEADEITIDMIPDGDKWHIFNWAMAQVGMGDAEQLKTFREEPETGVDAASDGKALRKPTE